MTCVRLRTSPIRVLLVLALGALPALAAPSLEGLLTRLAPADGRFASPYTQTRESTLLAEAVRTRGRIVYESPGYLRKTERPADGGGERVIEIRDDTVEIRGAEETRRFPVSRARPLEQMMRLLEALATGDSEALHRHFDVRLEGTDDDWTLTLEDPGARRGSSSSVHDDPLRIVVDGGTAVERITLQPPQGQTTVLELENDS